MNKKLNLAKTISYIILIFYALISLFPFFWAFLVSITH